MSLVLQGSVLNLMEGENSVSKVVLPRGDRGLAGRDGISVKGDAGAPGVQGPAGKDGRDSTVPGPVGDRGPAGSMGPCPVLTVGNVAHGETPSVTLRGPPEAPVLDFVLPRGVPGACGRTGPGGRDGNHEVIKLHTIGNSPNWHNDLLGCYVIADGTLKLPEMSAEDEGRWFVAKTFTWLNVSGLVEQHCDLPKDGSCKFVVVPYGEKYLFTGFKCY